MAAVRVGERHDVELQVLALEPERERRRPHAAAAEVDDLAVDVELQSVVTRHQGGDAERPRRAAGLARSLAGNGAARIARHRRSGEGRADDDAGPGPVERGAGPDPDILDTAVVVVAARD